MIFATYQRMRANSPSWAGTRLKGKENFSTTNHLQADKEESSDGIKTGDCINEDKLERIVETLDAFDCRLFLRATKWVHG